jgi:hypothetical protein
MDERYKPPANPERAKAEAERARSNAWGTHDNRPRRLRTRKAQKDAAKKDGEE